MPCGHTTCTGPVCTKANVPARPKVGMARQKAELMQALTEAAKQGHIYKTTANSLLVHYWTMDLVADFIRQAERHCVVYAKCHAKIAVLAIVGHYRYIVKVSFKFDKL